MKYYEAYDKRFRQVHEKNVSWFSNNPTPLILDVLEKYEISKNDYLLEVGCGEGRDARYLLSLGYNVLATDVSEEAISYAKKIDNNHDNSYLVIDACKDKIDKKFDFIYSVSALHMLVLDEGRKAFLDFIKRHLADDGKALILTMGDGAQAFQSDIETAFTNQLRTHSLTGEEFMLAGTSCKVVSFGTLNFELERSGFKVIEQGIINFEPDYPSLMYVVVN